eukprot:Skav212884  [mRNA]  locus=scaffold1006:292221:292472:+ [translate_table: standard]
MIPTPGGASHSGGLELAQKRLQDVTNDLDNFDKRMDDLLHIATNFNYPEDRGHRNGWGKLWGVPVRLAVGALGDEGLCRRKQQ